MAIISKTKFKMKKFTHESMQDILIYLKANTKCSIEVLNPDSALEAHAGELIEKEGITYVYRSYKAWNDLAELLFCKLLTPKVVSTYTIVLSFHELNLEQSFHNEKKLKEEKYGQASSFSLINKNEEPSYINAYVEALKNVKVHSRKNILNLGVNRADEFEVISKLLSKEDFDKLKLVGVDFCPSAIQIARERFPSNAVFHTHDINDLKSLNLEKTDLLISIGTLQSSSLNFKLLFMSLVQEYLNKDGSIILGFPNCRWMGGEMIFGAKAKNYSYSEMSVLHKDIYFCKKYLQQKKFRVTLTGKNYIFLSATKIIKEQNTASL